MAREALRRAVAAKRRVPTADADADAIDPPADTGATATRHSGGALDATAADVTAAADVTEDDNGPDDSTNPHVTLPTETPATPLGTAGAPPADPTGGTPAASATPGGASDNDGAADRGGPGQDRPDGTGPGARPADVAREALRAARDAARQAREDALAQGTGTGRGARRAHPAAASRAVADPGAASRSRGGAPGQEAARRARDVRELLADAFRMPADDDAPREEPGQESRDDDVTPQADSATPASASAFAPAPARDGDLRRTFPAFPPLPSDGTGFAATWWGNAWVAALEEGALDAQRLARGRGYAEQGNVDAITVTPGLVLAYVRGSRPRPYRVQVRLRTLEDADWERLLDSAAERPGHIAALLDKEMPHALAEGGVRLLPGPGDLEPHCSCPDRGHPCKHAAALCYQTARLLDADPFVLLLLRGRGERDLLDALSRLSATRAARAAQDQAPAVLPGVRAGDALAPRRLPPLPAPLPQPPHPEQPPVYPASPGGPDPFALDQLATDAAARAHALLATGLDPVGELTLWQDAVRLAAARPGSGLTAGTRALYASLAAAAGRTPSELARAVAAWRQGGLEGLAVLEEPWDPPAGRFDRARPLLLAADLPAFRPRHNHLTHPRGHVQLRLGRDGLWYAYESEPGHDDWWPRGTPDLDPVGALTGLGAAGEF
ncbi:hypothetical protein ADK37_25170 [Streptomyces resistomycificus]|uniref:SWIM-type domain-containing protein n=1 Tax=Streptomyces resistomycificus TaxID=67356 RepID=A0A0L8L468_9ACTN|nr:hypothetical protein ADK37_25170 [Streptomyces resistomycificus]